MRIERDDQLRNRRNDWLAFTALSGVAAGVYAALATAIEVGLLF